MIERDLDYKFIDKFGNVVFKGDNAFELLYSGKDLSVPIEESGDVEEYNSIMDKLGVKITKIKPYKLERISEEKFHTQRQKEWNMPIGYLELDVFEWFAERISSEEEIERVSKELELFEKYDCLNVLRFLIYLVDTFRENNLVWGVGRGSSVASYCLFIIGIHKVDSIKYKLDMDEFFKEVKNTEHK
jgi:DNA polymerase III alpha subunit